LAGVEREIREEISFSGNATQQLYAVINDDTNEVGSVHLGIVHKFELDSDEVVPLEKKLANLKFCTLEELSGPLYDKLETWSAICVDALKNA
jgi:predicted NUDIX family phosphoesterase